MTTARAERQRILEAAEHYYGAGLAGKLRELFRRMDSPDLIEMTGGGIPLVAVTADGYMERVAPGALRDVLGEKLPLTMDGAVIGEAVITSVDQDGIRFSAKVTPPG